MARRTATGGSPGAGQAGRRPVGACATRPAARAALLLVAVLVVPSLAPTAAAAHGPSEAVTQVTQWLAQAAAHVGSYPEGAMSNLSQADALFVDHLAQDASSPWAAAIAAEWEAAVGGATGAAGAGDVPGFGYYRQVLLKLQYALGWAETWAALNNTPNGQRAAEWFAVVAEKFAWSAADNDAAAAIENISNEPSQLAVRRAVVYNVTVAQFADKVLEEVAEVAVNLPDNRPVALAKAGEGLGYFYGLRFAVELERGAVEAALVEGAVRASAAAAWRGDAAAAQAAKGAVERALAGFLGADNPAGEIERLSSLAVLIADEYAAGVEGGAVVDAVEYEEARAFMADLSERWQRVAPQVRAAPGGQPVAAQVDVQITDIRAAIEAKGNEADLAADIGALRANLEVARGLVDEPQAQGPPAAPSESGPWVVLGLVAGTMVGVVVAALAFLMYLRSALKGLPARPPASAAATEEGPSK